MTQYLCSACGTLIYCAGEGSPAKMLRLGTVDDVHLHEMKLRLDRENWVKDRVCWLSPVKGLDQFQTSCSRPMAGSAASDKTVTEVVKNRG